MQPVGRDARRRIFDRDPRAYLGARPPYPSRVYEILAAECGLGPGCRVLEIGAGAGQATADLLEHGARVVAVEPGEGLAGVLAQRLGGDRLRIVRSDFETASVPPGPYDLVVSATAFHWLDTAAALSRIAGMLTPGGALAVWWTVYADPARPTEFRSALDRLYRRYLPGERREGPPGPLRVESWSHELRRGNWFGPVTVDLIRWTQRLTAESARRLWSSFPNVAELPPDQRAGFLDDLGALVERSSGAVEDPRVTAVYRTRPLV